MFANFTTLALFVHMLLENIIGGEIDFTNQFINGGIIGDIR